MIHETIYLIESRPAAGGPWKTEHNAQLAPGGYLESYSDALQRIELFGSATRYVYRIVPFVRTAAE